MYMGAISYYVEASGRMSLAGEAMFRALSLFRHSSVVNELAMMSVELRQTKRRLEKRIELLQDMQQHIRDVHLDEASDGR